jgi:mediator of RNA polymerase II transcription subunit 17, fungi type
VKRLKARLTRSYRQAYMEAYYALDFVSLLLSKETPRQAEISLSRAVQLLVPLGSLGADKVPTPQLSPEEQRDQELVSRGWKLQGLENTAESLLRSADRLEKEVGSESKYWVQILAVRDKGWSVCRLPRERHTLGVRFGFREGELLNRAIYIPSSIC